MHSKKDVFRPSFLCSFKHALLQSLDFVVTGFSYFKRGREVGGGERLLPIMAYTQLGAGGGGVRAKLNPDRGINQSYKMGSRIIIVRQKQLDHFH